MLVYSQLEKASLENLSSDPASPATGRVWYNTTDKKVKYHDGTDTKVLMEVSEDQQGPTILDTASLLDAGYFPDTTNLYAWSNNGSTDYDDNPWTGSKDLLEGGALTSSTNHLGSTAYCNFDGASYMYFNNADTTFDTADEDFTFYAWIKPDTTVANDVIASKWERSGNKRSWVFYLDSSSKLNFAVSYDGTSSNSVSIDASDLYDGNYHFVVCKYNYVGAAEMWLELIIDGNSRLYKKYTANTGRDNDANSDLIIGAQSNAGAESYFQGEITDFGYKVDILSDNELRKIYAAGSRKFCTIDGNSNVAIMDGRRTNGYYNIAPSDDNNVSTNDEIWPIYIPEDGIYRIVYNFAVYTDDTTSDSIASVRYAIQNDTAGTDLTEEKNVYFNSGADDIYVVPCHAEKTTYLNKDDKIVLRIDNAVDKVDMIDSNVSWEKLD